MGDEAFQHGEAKERGNHYAVPNEIGNRRHFVKAEFHTHDHAHAAQRGEARPEALPEALARRILQAAVNQQPFNDHAAQHLLDAHKAPAHAQSAQAFAENLRHTQVIHHPFKAQADDGVLLLPKGENHRHDQSAQRFQLPFYFGVGLSYNDAAPIKFMGFAVGAKLRARFYITDRIGIWGGGSAKFGYGETQVTADMSKSVYQRVLALETGITFSL